MKTGTKITNCKGKTETVLMLVVELLALMLMSVRVRTRVEMKHYVTVSVNFVGIRMAAMSAYVFKGFNALAKNV